MTDKNLYYLYAVLQSLTVPYPFCIVNLYGCLGLWILFLNICCRDCPSVCSRESVCHDGWLLLTCLGQYNLASKTYCLNKSHLILQPLWFLAPLSTGSKHKTMLEARSGAGPIKAYPRPGAKLKNGSASGLKGSGLQNKTFHCQICDVHVNSEIQLKQVQTQPLHTDHSLTCPKDFWR